MFLLRVPVRGRDAGSLCGEDGATSDVQTELVSRQIQFGECFAVCHFFHLINGTTAFISSGRHTLAMLPDSKLVRKPCANLVWNISTLDGGQPAVNRSFNSQVLQAYGGINWVQRSFVIKLSQREKLS